MKSINAQVDKKNQIWLFTNEINPRTAETLPHRGKVTTRSRHKVIHTLMINPCKYKCTKEILHCIKKKNTIILFLSFNILTVGIQFDNSI